MRARRLAWFGLAALGACASAKAASPPGAPPLPLRVGVGVGVGVAAAEPVVAPPAPASPPKGLLTIAEARAYMVRLINRDRAGAGLSPVSLDDGVATRAGQAHAQDMAVHGYLGHWGTDGSVPEQRYT